jgi:hypothetical protein
VTTEWTTLDDHKCPKNISSTFSPFNISLLSSNNGAFQT